MGTKPSLLATIHDPFSWMRSAVFLYLFIISTTLTAQAADPVITLQGSNPATVIINTNYVDAGATAIDSFNDSVTVEIDDTSVDTSKVGSYTVNFSATDSTFNTGTATRAVKVIVVLTPILSLLLDDDQPIDPNADLTPPVVTIIGNSPVLVLKGQAYIDAGATAVDNIDGARPVSSNALLVNTSVVNTYNVHYSAQDLSGNTGTADRTVEVVEDTIPPVIITDSFNIEAGSIFTDSQILTSDNSNGEVTLTRKSFINTAIVGSTTVSYTATDPSGNSVDKDITVNVVDTTQPQLVVAGANPVTIEAGSTYADAGAVAVDNSKGTITINTMDAAINTSSVATHIVSYTATDASGNTSNTMTRNVNVVDTSPPEITLVGRNPLAVLVGGTYVEESVTSVDNSSSPNNTTVTIDSTAVDTSTVGSYQVNYTAEDAEGNISPITTRTVNVIQIDDTPPVITLNGSTNIQVILGSSYTDAGATAVDNVDGLVNVIFDDTLIDTSTLSTPASPTISLDFTASDAAQNSATTVTRFIEIVKADALSPVIFLDGENPITVEQGSTYVDPGATAFDVTDGDVAVTIDTSGVNTSVVNATGLNNVVTFVATDVAGNTFNRTRNVIVEAVPNLGVIKGQWHLNENTATTANDSSGNNNHLTVHNIAESNWVTGRSGSAVNFVESNVQQASIGTATNAVQPASVTLSAWIYVNPNPSPAARDWEWIAAQGDNYGLYIFPDRGELVFYKREMVRDTWEGVDSLNNVINFSQWHHVVGTFDSATHTMKLYLDGVEVDSKSTNNSNEAFEGIGFDQGDGFTIGSMQGGRLFNGIIDEVTVYDKAVPAQDINFLMNRTLVDTLAPVITLNGADSLRVIVDTQYVDQGATVTDDTNSGLVASNDANLTVNTSTLGVYPVTFRATDNAGNTAKKVRSVEVITEDTTSPTITLNGPNPVIVALNTIYSDLSGTAIDDVDGNVNVVTNTAFVDTSVAGTYAVTFTAQDAAGNIGTATRAVKVLVNPPVNESVFVGTYDGSDQPVGGRRGSIVFNDYIDANDPGAIASWLTQSSGNILTVNSDFGFTAALQAAQPGDRIQLETGVYKMQPISLSGTENNPITIESVPGQWAIFDGAKAGSASQITVNETAWLNFRNFEIRNGTTSSIYITKSHHHLYEGLKIHNNARGFDFTHGSSHSLIRFNESYHNFNPTDHGQNGDGFGIWSEGPFNDPIGEGVILEHNIAWGNSDDGIDMYKNEANVTLRNNIARNSGFNVLNDPIFSGNGNGYKLGPYGEDDATNLNRPGHIVIGNIADSNPIDGFDSNGGTAIHYLRGNAATHNFRDYEVPNLNAGSKDNVRTGGIFPSEVNPGQ